MARFKKGQTGLVPHTDAPEIVQYSPGIKIMADSILSWGFDMPTTLPLLVYRGPGRTAGQLDVYPSAAQSWAPLAVPVNSFGGSQAGKFILSPLVDTTGDNTVD